MWEYMLNANTSTLITPAHFIHWGKEALMFALIPLKILIYHIFFDN